MKKSILALIICLAVFSCGKKKAQTESASHHQHTVGSPDTTESVKHAGHTVSGKQSTDINIKLDQKSKEILQLDSFEIIKANIHTALAAVKSLNQGVKLLGIVASNEKTTTIISAKVTGRIIRLFEKKIGTFIYTGQPLFGIYSEQLFTDIKDYLFSLSQRDSVYINDFARKITAGSRKRLLLSGITEPQLNTIRETRKIPPYITYYSPVTGIISQQLIGEGEYVETGMPLFEVADLRTVWIETQVYPEEVKLININTSVTVELEAYPGKNYNGSIVFTNPAFEASQKVNLVRIKINNPGYLAKPGMMAYVNVLGKNKQALVIPKTALITQDMTMVWVQLKKGTFERRLVTTGAENKREVEILSGLEEGEIVVTTGSYLLNSEYILQKGSNSMAGMKM